MKNRIPFAALTFAFTIAGGAIGYNLDAANASFLVFVVALVGALAAGLSGETA